MLYATDSNTAAGISGEPGAAAGTTGVQEAAVVDYRGTLLLVYVLRLALAAAYFVQIAPPLATRVDRKSSSISSSCRFFFSIMRPSCYLLSTIGGSLRGVVPSLR